MQLLDFEPYKGITVRSFTTKDLYEVFEVRASLESLAASLAATNITEHEINKLESILEKMLDCAQRDDVVNRTSYNNQFHDVIIKASGNKLIQRLSNNLRFASWSHTSGAITSMDPIQIAKRHTLIIESLRSGDPERAEKVMKSHILSSLEGLVKKLEEEERLQQVSE